MQNFRTIGNPLLGEKYVAEKENKRNKQAGVSKKLSSSSSFKQALLGTRDAAMDRFIFWFYCKQT
jgi:hypothetical protein